MTFKPKKQQIHVPGYGVVQKEDFGQVHFNALMKRAGENRDEFIKQHLVVESYDDLPIFAEDETEQKPAPKAGKKKTKADKDAEEEAELQKQIEEEEREKQ